LLTVPEPEFVPIRTVELFPVVVDVAMFTVFVVVESPMFIVPVAPPMLRVPVRPVLNSASVPEVTLVVIIGFLRSRVPVVAPTVSTVAAPPKLRVVAVVLIRLKVVDAVSIPVVMDGDVIVFTPAKVWAPVVTIPEAEPEATGTAATEIVDEVPVIDAVGPAVVPAVHVQVVGKVFVSVSTQGTFTTA
jgi:hypothetical protein